MNLGGFLLEPGSILAPFGGELPSLLRGFPVAGESISQRVLVYSSTIWGTILSRNCVVESLGSWIPGLPKSFNFNRF